MYCIYTDGACSNNIRGCGIGGFSAIITGEKDRILKTIGGSQKNTTNNRMELWAVIAGLKGLSHLINHKTSQINCNIYSDSKYVVENWNDYIENWVEHGWRRSNNKKVINVDLWKILYPMVYEFKIVKFYWIKGHQNNKLNELADKTAVKFVNKLKKWIEYEKYEVS